MLTPFRVSETEPSLAQDFSDPEVALAKRLYFIHKRPASSMSESVAGSDRSEWGRWFYRAVIRDLAQYKILWELM